MHQGMIKQNIFERFELLFWNLAIQVLTSTRSARKGFASLRKLMRRHEAVRLSVLFLLCGFAGLVSGYLFFVVTH